MGAAHAYRNPTKRVAAKTRGRRSVGIGDRRATAINLAAALGAQAMLAATGVVLARGLGPSDRGLVALFILVPTIAFQAGSLGVPLSTTFALARAPDSGPSIRASLLRIGAVQLAVLIPVSAVILLVAMAGDSGEVKLVGLMMPLIVAAGLAQLYGASALQGHRRFVAYNVIYLIPLALFALGETVLLLIGGLTVASALAVYTGALTIGGLGGILVIDGLKQSSSSSHSAVSDRWMLRFGIRGMLGSPNSFDALRLDQAVVGLFLAPAALGYYTVAISFTNLPRFVARAVGAVAYPRVAEHRDPSEARSAMWRFFWVALPMYGTVSVALWFGAPWLVDFFFGSDFTNASTITRILLVSTVLICARLVLSEGARGAGYPTLSSAAELAALSTLLVSAAILVPQSNATGVAWALVISAVVGLMVLGLGLLWLRGTQGEPGLEPETGVMDPATVDA
jgi:O-antigen/teichoic acid export membrane protein